MFIIKHFREEKAVKYAVSVLLCVLFLFNSLSVFADEEPVTEQTSEQATSEQTSEQATSEQTSEQATEQATEQILTEMFTSSDYQLITVILLLVLIVVVLLKFIL